jgi:glucokinase
MRILAGDVGGTKTILRAIASGAEPIEHRYESGAYGTFDDLVSDFLRIAPGPYDAACFAVAGPVIADKAEITNLSWSIVCGELVKRFPVARVELVNDFHAIGIGVPLLGPDDGVRIHEGSRRHGAPIAILGAGTGLGESFVTFARDAWTVIPSEGGHADFAPQDEEQCRLFVELRERYGHVSWERLLSGAGLVNIFTFLGGDTDDAAEVARLASEGDATARRAFEIFVDIYGAEAGNMALRILARGGVFLAGGIAAKNSDRFTDGRFLAAFLRKGRFRELLEEMPVDLITNERVGLLGAGELARRAATAALESKP